MSSKSAAPPTPKAPSAGQAVVPHTAVCRFCRSSLAAGALVCLACKAPQGRYFLFKILQGVLTVVALPMAAWIGAEVWKSYQQEQSRKDELRMEENRVLEKLTSELQGTLDLANDAFDARSAFRNGCPSEASGSPGGPGQGVASEGCSNYYLAAVRKLDLSMNRLSWQVTMLALISPETYERWKQLKSAYWTACAGEGPAETCGWRQQLVTALYGYPQADSARGLPIGLRYCYGERANGSACTSAAEALREKTLDPIDNGFNTFFCSFAVDLNRTRLAIYSERQRAMDRDREAEQPEPIASGYAHLVSVLKRNLASSTCVAMIEKATPPSQTSDKVTSGIH